MFRISGNCTIWLWLTSASWCAIHLERNYSAAAEAFQEALSLIRSLSPESEYVASLLNSLAGIEKASGDDDAAERDYKEALRIANKINDREGIAIYTGNLAAFSLDRQDWP